MFCPKCGSKNSDDTAFCRFCGANLSKVLAAVEGSISRSRDTAERYLELYARGIKGILAGVGFFIVAAIALVFVNRSAAVWLFGLAFAFVFLAAGISRLVHASAVKKLENRDATGAAPEIGSGAPDYIRPSRSIYDTDDLAPVPGSVTEHTTRHLDE